MPGKNLVKKNRQAHGLNLEATVAAFLDRNEMVVAVDSVHGASRLHIRELFNDNANPRLVLLRNTADVTFGGVAPEPSTVNMREVVRVLGEKKGTSQAWGNH